MTRFENKMVEEKSLLDQAFKEIDDFTKTETNYVKVLNFTTAFENQENLSQQLNHCYFHEEFTTQENEILVNFFKNGLISINNYKVQKAKGVKRRKNVYTIVNQKDESIFKTCYTLKEAKKAFKDFYYWNPSKIEGIALYKNGSIYSEDYTATNPIYN